MKDINFNYKDRFSHTVFLEKDGESLGPFPSISYVSVNYLNNADTDVITRYAILGKKYQKYNIIIEKSALEKFKQIKTKTYQKIKKVFKSAYEKLNYHPLI